MHIQKTKAELASLYLKDVKKNRFLNRSDLIPRVLDLKVCPRCGFPALKDKGYAKEGIVRCVTAGCHFSGPASKFYDVAMHLVDGGG